MVSLDYCLRMRLPEPVLHASFQILFLHTTILTRCPPPGKDRLADEFAGLWEGFQVQRPSRPQKRKYPIQEFRLFAGATRRYVEVTEARTLLNHRSWSKP